MVPSWGLLDLRCLWAKGEECPVGSSCGSGMQPWDAAGSWTHEEIAGIESDEMT